MRARQFCTLEDVISEPGEIFDHGYVQRSTVLWQCHQSRISAKISIHTPDVVNEITHLMKVSKISSLEVQTESTLTFANFAMETSILTNVSGFC